MICLPVELEEHETFTLAWVSVEELFPFSESIEITTEANPETVDQKYIDGLLFTTVTRVSLGAQSFNEKYLKDLERKASPKSIWNAAELLWKNGYRNFSLDLINGIPGQGPAEILSDIESAVSLMPKHLSIYNLTLKPAHPLYSQLPDSDHSAVLYEAAVSEMERRGYEQYEISNFSKPGFQCEHNRLYWEGGDYLGIGPSASSRFFIDSKFVHHKQIADTNMYLAKPVFDPARLEKTDHKQTVLEAAFLELRENKGVNLKDFESRYSYDLCSGQDFKLFEREGLLEKKEGILKLTSRGRLLADTVTERLVDFTLLS